MKAKRAEESTVVKMRIIPKEEAQQTRRVKEPGIRRQRMTEFDAYVQVVIDNPGEAIVFEEIGEPGQKFVLSLRGALKRHGLEHAIVRKMRSRDEIRVWRTAGADGLAMTLPGEDSGALMPEPEAELEREPAAVTAVNEPEAQAAPRRGRPRKAS